MKSVEHNHSGAAHMAPRSISDVIHSLPKTEIHIHAEATVSFESYFALNQKYHADPSLKQPSDFRRLLEMDSLGVMIKNFFYLQSLFRAPEDFKYVVSDVRDYAARNNIQYLELFVAPSMVLKRGEIDFAGIMDPLVEGFSAVFAQGGPDVRLLVDVSRAFGRENAENNLKQLLSYRKKRSTDRILGIGLGGQEAGNPCLAYRAVFKRAHDEGLHVVAHAGEEVGPESIRDAVVELGAERIGHGTSAIQDESLMDLLRERAIPLEICPTSNVVTGKYVHTYEEHPMKTFYDRGLLVTLNTDDPVLFDVELEDEYLSVAERLGFGIKGIEALLRNGIRASFMDEAQKKKASVRLESAIAALS
ncbi:MAG TPA: adenosine deaminase [Rectinemataceae bacterium]|nr:adenosine deaminase [Rectinemataceae bacterium]